jgi:cardiolipin synthase
MLNVPNAITLLRLALVPVLAALLWDERYASALAVFLAAALSDALDGFIARRYGVSSRFGATLDPVADKLSMFAATVLLAWQHLLPLWLAVAIVARDVVIVGGVIAYRAIIGEIEMAPTRLSKLNTTLEFALLLVAMAIGAEWLSAGGWLPALFVIVGATVVASGVQYVWIGIHKAAAAHARRANT